MIELARNPRRVFPVLGVFLAGSVFLGCGEEKPAATGDAAPAAATSQKEKDASVVKKGGRQLNADGPSARDLRNEKLKAAGGN